VGLSSGMGETLPPGPNPYGMRFTQFLCCLPLLLCACEPSNADRIVLATNTQDLVFCCDTSISERTKIGEFLIQIYNGQLQDLRPSTIEATVATNFLSEAPPGTQHTLTSPVQLSVSSGDDLDVGSNTVEVFLLDCDFSRVTVDIDVQVTGRRISDNAIELLQLQSSFDVVNTCPPRAVPASPPEELVSAVLGEPVADFEQYGVDTATGVPTLNASPDIEPQVPMLDFTEVFQIGGVTVTLTQDQLDEAFLGTEPRFPIGPAGGNFGRTFQPVRSQTMMPGDYLLAWQSVEGEIPLDDPERTLQFSLVLDRDGDTGNNFMAAMGQENNPQQNTDTFFQGFYNPNSGFSFVVQDGQTTPPGLLTSSARMVFFGQVQFFVIPLAELGNPTDLRGRFITFAHFGDFGSIEPWSADPTPPVTEARFVFDTQPIN